MHIYTYTVGVYNTNGQRVQYYLSQPEMEECEVEDGNVVPIQDEQDKDGSPTAEYNRPVMILLALASVTLIVLIWILQIV